MRYTSYASSMDVSFLFSFSLFFNCFNLLPLLSGNLTGGHNGSYRLVVTQRVSTAPLSLSNHEDDSFLED
ncbi:hypothetical protein BDV32DRAFT_120949 [Aspergillus pseudonomiae]|nr:hypothetical protein BDV32DRAFT_120949 [Aspergillus pseudonomiae]